jgi:hypothetical protein
MNTSSKFYKIKLIKKLIAFVHEQRQILLSELITNATDPTIFNRRCQMLQQLNLYENQLVAKIYNFETDSIDDLQQNYLFDGINLILNRSA